MLKNWLQLPDYCQTRWITKHSKLSDKAKILKKKHHADLKKLKNRWEKVIDIHHSGKGYKAISKALAL